MDATQPTTAQLVEAIEAGWDIAECESLAAGNGWNDPQRVDSVITAGREAFAAYRQRHEALEVENAKMRKHIDDLHESHEEDVDTIDKLRKALTPFAVAHENVTDLDDDDDIVDENMQIRYKVGTITAGDLIRAKIALLTALSEVK